MRDVVFGGVLLGLFGWGCLVGGFLGFFVCLFCNVLKIIYLGRQHCVQSLLVDGCESLN